MKPWTEPENITKIDEGLMVMAAFRYCLGRRTYIVGACVDFLKANWQHLDHRTREVIERDLREEVLRDDEARERQDDYRPLGDACDRDRWLHLRDFIDNYNSTPTKEVQNDDSSL